MNKLIKIAVLIILLLINCVEPANALFEIRIRKGPAEIRYKYKDKAKIRYGTPDLNIEYEIPVEPKDDNKSD